MLPTLTLSDKRRVIIRYAFVLIALLCFSRATWAQISIPNTSFTYTETFNTLPISGTGHTAVPAGWAFFETSVNFSTNTTFQAGDVSGAYFQVAYDTYSLGATGNSDRAFGSMTSTNQDSLNSTIGACFTNNTGSTITSMTVTYTGETWRVSSQNRVDGLVFQYNQNTTAINGSGTWTAFTALDYFNPGAPTVGGGSLRHSAGVSATISGLNIAPGNTFCFRWLNFNATAAAQGNPNQEDALGVDDFSLSNIVVCTPPVVTAPTVMQPTCGAPSGGAITVNATGISALEYSVNNGSTWSTNPVFSGLAAGNYFIKVRLQANQSCEATYGSNPVVLTSPFTASTTADTWTGCVSTNWATPGNWADGSVPTAADDVTIPDVANDPVIMGGTAALARSVLVQAGAVLTINTTGSLTINNSAVHGLDNYGTVDNSGDIIVGNTTAIGAIGIVHRNGGAFNNKPGGYIQIDRALGQQAFYSIGLVNNEGDIEIGSNAAVSGEGIRMAGNTFNNKSGGSIQIDQTGNQAILVQAGALLSINAMGSLTINNSAVHGLDNYGTVDNSGDIIVGNTTAIGNNSGVVQRSGALFSNNAGASLTINAAYIGILNAGTTNNTGTIVIGNISSLIHDGIQTSGIFNNNIGGTININRTGGFGGVNNSGTFTNAGGITIGDVAISSQDALENYGTFINAATGDISVDRGGNGIWHIVGTFQNSGKITVGSIANTGTGILSLVPFTNNAGAEIHIDRAGSGIVSTNAFTNAGLIRMGENAPLTGSGIANVQGAAAVFNNNAGGDISIKQTAVDGVQNDVNSTFNNNACATLTIFDNLSNSGSFTNAGLFTVNTIQTHTNSALTNNGIIAYPVGNPIPNVTNNEIVIAPTTANDCDVISPAFGLGSPVNFTIQGIFTNEAATMSAGTYTTATNTFTPTTILGEGVRTFYVKIMDGIGGCTRIIPWQLTTEDCCDAPQAICKTATIVLVGNSASLSVADVNDGSTADCGLHSITVSPNTFNCSHVGTPQTVTLTITDVNGASASCQTTVTIQDNTAPSITCPTTQTLVLGANCTATLPNYTSLATTGDNCGVQGVTQSPAAGTTVSGAGNMTVTLTVTDLNGNPTECSFTVTKVDNTPPTITCPATQTLVLGANCTATLPNYTSLATTGDNCGVQGVTQSPAAGTTVSGAGNMIVTLTVTDINGNPAECSFTVTKVDNTPPTITCPATQTLVLGANCTATLPNYTSLATTGDNCGVQGVTQSPVAGTTVSSAGNMTVTLTVTDINGLTNSCTFTVTKVDNTPPTITCPATQTLVLGANCTATLPNYTSLATTGDNCGVQGVTQSPVAGTTVSSAGNMTVTLTVTDINGLTNSCTFTVTKVDNTPPTITCPATQTLVLGANCTATLPNYTSMAITGENCGVQGVTQSPIAGTTVSSAGNMTVTLTVTDINGLTNSCTFTVTKVDNTAPSITCPTTKTLVLGANCTATLPNYTSMAITGDNCGVQGVTQSPAAGTTVSGTGNMTVTLTVTDVNGLTNSCTFTVTKMDETPPTVVCKNTTVFLNAAGNYTLLAGDVFNATASSDNCSGELTVTNISPATVNCAQVGQSIPVTVTVQDAAGNSTTCTAQVTVQEGLTLPGGWSSNNVGNANGSGGYKPCTTASGQFTVSATGFSTSSADVLHLTSRQLCGNGEIIARVANLSGGGWAGITLRETLTPGSKKVALKTQNNGNIRREIRTVTNGATNNLNYFRTAHSWLRLVRNGSTFTGYTSIDGSAWTFAFSATVSMTGCIYAGLFAESINSNVTTTAIFDNVQIIGGTSSLIEAQQTPATPLIFSPEVYPNPTNGEVNIDLNGYANPIGTVKVFDAYGKLIIQNQLDGSDLFRMKLDGDDGVYFLSIEVEGEAPITKRVVVAH